MKKYDRDYLIIVDVTYDKNSTPIYKEVENNNEVRTHQELKDLENKGHTVLFRYEV